MPLFLGAHVRACFWSRRPAALGEPGAAAIRWLRTLGDRHVLVHSRLQRALERAGRRRPVNMGAPS